MQHKTPKHLESCIAFAFLAMATQGTAYAAPTAVQENPQPIEAQALLDDTTSAQADTTTHQREDKSEKESQTIDNTGGAILR